MERRKLKFELLLEKYFTNFGKILLANLLFALPSMAFIAAFYYLSLAIFGGRAYIPFILLCIIPIYPFYAGVVKTVRNIVRGDESFSVLQAFLSGIKENFLPFLLHGFVISAASIISFLSINLYIGLLSQSWIFGALLFFCIVVVLFVFFASFYLPLMTVTFDLPLRYIYKNSFLMSYGEFKNNIFATFALAVLAAIVLTVMLVSGGSLLLVILLAVLWALLIPATYTFIYAFFVYEGMYTMVSGEGRKQYEKDKKEAADKPKPQAPVVEEADISSIDVSKLQDTDDYIFFNGKMVKQSALLKMVREKLNTDQEEQKNE